VWPLGCEFLLFKWRVLVHYFGIAIADSSSSAAREAVGFYSIRNCTVIISVNFRDLYIIVQIYGHQFDF